MDAAKRKPILRLADHIVPVPRLSTGCDEVSDGEGQGEDADVEGEVGHQPLRARHFLRAVFSGELSAAMVSIRLFRRAASFLACIGY